MGARIVGFCPSKKNRFPNEIEAKIALLSAQRKRDRRGDEMVEIRWYKCHLCRGGWHLTHLTEQEYAERRAESEREKSDGHDAVRSAGRKRA